MWKIVETEEQLLLLSSLSNSELKELQLIKNSTRRKEKLAIYLLLDHLFEDKVLLNHSNNGSPYLQNMSVQISISHTSRFACILTHPQKRVGIDIEMLNRNFRAVEKKALSKEEIESLSDLDRDFHLAVFWSAKESIFKRFSHTGVDFAKQIFIRKFSPQERGLLTAIFLGKNGKKEEIILNYEVLEDHIMTWVVG